MNLTLRPSLLVEGIESLSSLEKRIKITFEVKSHNLKVGESELNSLLKGKNDFKGWTNWIYLAQEKNVTFFHGEWSCTFTQNRKRKLFRISGLSKVWIMYKWIAAESEL